MNATRLAAIVLIVFGVLALVYGGFTTTRETHHATIGPIDLAVHEERVVPIPVWIGVGAIALGGALLLWGTGRR